MSMRHKTNHFGLPPFFQEQFMGGTTGYGGEKEERRMFKVDDGVMAAKPGGAAATIM